MRISKLLSLMLALSVLALSFAGCTAQTDPSGSISSAAALTSGTATSAESETAENTGVETESSEGSSSRVLVVYFSRTGEQYNVGVIDKGNTAIVAEMIAESADADIWEVLPTDDHYPMTYSELTDVAKQEQNDNARPAYAGEAPDLSQYDTIFIGAPVWWGDWPMIMYTFFEDNKDGLSGKTLIPFSTHEGSGLSGFNKKLAAVCPDSTIKDGLAIQGQDAQNDQDGVRARVDEWVAGLGL